MSRGKSRLFGRSRGTSVKLDDDLVETFVVNVDDLEFDSLFIESRQQKVFNRKKDDVENRTFYKPKSNLVIDGRTVGLDGEEFLDFFMNIMGELGDTSDMKADAIRNKRKRIHKSIIRDFQSDDWEDVIEKYKRRMHKRNIHLLRFRVDNSKFSPTLVLARPLVAEPIDRTNVVGFLKEHLSDEFERFEEEDIIIDENQSNGYVVRGGFKLHDVGDKVIMTPFMAINDERFEFGENSIFKTDAWREDVTSILMKDFPFVEDLTISTTINSRRPLKKADDKFVGKAVKNLRGKLYSERGELPKDIADGIITSFEKNLEKYCNSDKFGESSVCVDLALDRTVSSYSFTPRIKRKIRGIMLKFSGDV